VLKFEGEPRVGIPPGPDVEPLENSALVSEKISLTEFEVDVGLL
jgi:hypothetical protein